MVAIVLSAALLLLAALAAAATLRSRDVRERTTDALAEFWDWLRLGR